MTEVKEGPIVSHADAISREEDDREERAAQNFEALTGVKSVEPLSTPVATPSPEKSMFTPEEIKRIEEDYEPSGHWDK